MFAAGNHAGSIGVRLNRSLYAVYRRAMKLGVPTVGRHIQPAFWTDERVEQARVWWLQNKPASWISDQLGQGVTKNSVISKMHRRGYVRPNPASMTAEACKANKARRAKRRHRTDYRLASVAKAQLQPTPLPPTLKVDMARICHDELEASHCRWPVGNAGLAAAKRRPVFCGAQRMPGMPYCPHHVLHAYDYIPPHVHDREPSFAPKETGAKRTPRAGVIRGTLEACRHGGITELGDAGATEQEGMASTGHTSPAFESTRNTPRPSAPTRSVNGGYF